MSIGEGIGTFTYLSDDVNEYLNIKLLPPTQISFPCFSIVLTLTSLFNNFTSDISLLVLMVTYDKLLLLPSHRF